MVTPGFCQLYLTKKKKTAEKKLERTLMDEPEVRPEEVILNGVALRPRVNSGKHKGKKKASTLSIKLSKK